MAITLGGARVGLQDGSDSETKITYPELSNTPRGCCNSYELTLSYFMKINAYCPNYRVIFTRLEFPVCLNSASDCVGEVGPISITFTF